MNILKHCLLKTIKVAVYISILKEQQVIHRVPVWQVWPGGELHKVRRGFLFIFDQQTLLL